MKRKELLALPTRNWQQTSLYDALYLVPTGKKHDSGYSLIAIVGIEGGEAKEIAAICDDICWSFPTSHPYDGIRDGLHRTVMRTDCEWPSGIMRVWASGEHYFRGLFEVGHSLSSTDVTLIIKPRGDSEPAKQLEATLNA